jgi:hypothetical protein
MYFLDRNVPSVLQALLAERVSLGVTLTNLPPLVAVPFVCFRVTAAAKCRFK